jgi:hypothetical protein
MQKYSKLDRPEILSLLFHPRKEPKTPLPEGAIDLDISVDHEVFLGCRFYISDLSSPSILYFHGNGEIVCDHDEIARGYMNVGCNLLVMSYRGYGWSSGFPTVTSLFQDAVAAFGEVKEQLAHLGASGPLFVMGRSLGSAPAIEVALRFGDSLKGLILESSFADSLPLFRTLGIDTAKMGILEEEGFGNRKKISAVTLPTLFLHGARDQLIPSSEAEKLQADSGARNKQFLLIPGADHNSLISFGGIQYFLTIRRFIDAITGESSWRNIRKQRKNRQSKS